VMNSNNIDPYAELKAAHAAGKTIQLNYGRWLGKDDWRDFAPNDWSCPLKDYRIKPEPEAPLNPQHLGKNAPGEYKHHSKEKCLVIATGYFYQENEACSWYWLLKYESGL